MERLQRAARRMGRTPSETAAILIDEATRQLEFANIEFRDSIVGRQAYVRGSRVAVWQVAMLARDFDGVPGDVAKHLEWNVDRVKSALAYAAAFPDEIHHAIEDNRRYDFQEVSRQLPTAEKLIIKARRAQPPAR